MTAVAATGWQLLTAYASGALCGIALTAWCLGNRGIERDADRLNDVRLARLRTNQALRQYRDGQRRQTVQTQAPFPRRPPTVR